MRPWLTKSVLLSEKLGVEPVEEKKAVGDNQNPGEKRQRFVEAFEERRAILFSPVDLREDVDQPQDR